MGKGIDIGGHLANRVRGFSLLEVLVAVTLFTVVVTSVYTTFRTAMRAYEMGMESGKTLQTGRFSMDVVSRDLKSAFYRVETEYNEAYRSRLQNIQQEIQNSQDRVADHDKIAEMIDEFNLSQVGIDLSFRGSESEVSFVRKQIQVGARVLQPMRLARVRYYVEDRKLLREEHDVFLMPIDYDAQELEPEKPNPDVIVENVEEFKLVYGFYFDGEWMEATEWDSSSRSKRSDAVDIPPTDPMLEVLRQNVQQIINRMPEDGLPGYIRMTLSVKDEEKGSAKTFHRTINVANALETHVPLPEEFVVSDEEGQPKSFFRGQFYLEPKGSKREKKFDFEGTEERPRRAERMRRL